MKSPRHKLFWIIVTLAVVSGLGVRLYLALRPSDRFVADPLLEDAFYALSVSRSLALGNGLTIDGYQPTSGFQPLTTVGAAVLFAAFPNDEILPVRAFLLVSIVVTLLIAHQVGRLAQLLTDSPNSYFVAASLYLLSPRSVQNDLNGLETGCVTLLVLTTIVYFGCRLNGSKRLSRQATIVFGLLLGLACLARVDALVLLPISTFVHILSGGKSQFRQRVIDSSLFCAVAVLTFSPWLLRNWLTLGTPISSSISANIHGFYSRRLDMNFLNAVRALYDLPFLLPVGRWLWRLGNHVWIHVAALAIFVAQFALLYRLFYAARGDEASRRVRIITLFTLIYASSMCVSYILITTCHWYMHRYLFPVVSAAIPLGVWLFWPVAQRLTASRSGRFVIYLGTAVLLLHFAGGMMRHIEKPASDYWRVALYLRQNYPGARIAAFQSGTVGYFCANVTNLDGKVNPEVIEFLRAGQIVDYLLERRFDVVTDWPELLDPIMKDSRLARLYRRIDTDVFVTYVKEN